MKMRQTLPILFLTLAIVACGKKDNSVATTAPVAAVPQPYPYSPTNPTWPTNPGTNDLASFCQYSGGSISGNLCRIERNYQNQSWFSISIGDFNTGVPVYTGEKVTINMSGNARIYVGNYQYGTGSTTFVSSSQGYLTLQKYTSTYSVQQVRVQTCYSSPNQRDYCN